MKVDTKTVEYISKLAKLKFTEEETSKLSNEFENILSHFESMDKIDLSSVNLDLLSDGLESVLRKDEVSYFEDKEKLFRNTKAMKATAIVVPKIIE